MKILVNNVLMFLFFGLFWYQMSKSVRKWFNSRTDYGITRVDVDKIQFPSISVCSKFTLKDKEVTPTLFGIATPTEKKQLALDNIWRKNEVFQFVSHPGIFGMTYPCVTSNDGLDPGKPCHFPFRWILFILFGLGVVVLTFSPENIFLYICCLFFLSPWNEHILAIYTKIWGFIIVII